MLFSPCSPLHGSCDVFDSDMDKYFDFEAASSPIVDKGRDSLQPSIDELESELRIMALRQAVDSNSYQVKMDVDGIWNTEFFEPSASAPPWNNSQFDFEWLDSESSSSAPSSPSSIFSTLQFDFERLDSESSSSAPSSPSSIFSTLSSHSPISCELLEAGSNGFPEEDDAIIMIIPSPMPCVQAEHEVIATFNSPRAPCCKTSLPPSEFAHALRPVSPRSVRGLEHVVQPPAEVAEHPAALVSEEPSPVISPTLKQRPRRSPSPCDDKEGRIHLVGWEPSKTKGRPKCPFPGCIQKFTRMPDVKRHIKDKHTIPNLPELFGEIDEKKRRWCLGCLCLLSREDSRRRHEHSCRWFGNYVEAGNVLDENFVPLTEVYAVEPNDGRRLWCSKCYEVHLAPGIRHHHEQTCDPPPFDSKTYYPRPAPLRFPERI
ncbi:hypothetical protein C8R45DRAFT_1152737 [Mycena sanguinolenta]|nr:hypothetical protein C8R45DRAFT_1152737 [Mycena sanguinolenta]